MGKITANSLIHLLQGDECRGAAFTAKSLRTGKDFTFKVTRKSFGGKMFTHIYVEVEYLEFKHLGFYTNGVVIKKGSSVTTPAALGIAFILRNVERGEFEKLNSQVEVMSLGKCLRCGRTLTDAVSIETGLGPHCRTN